MRLSYHGSDVKMRKLMTCSRVEASNKACRSRGLIVGVRSLVHGAIGSELVSARSAWVLGLGASCTGAVVERAVAFKARPLVDAGVVPTAWCVFSEWFLTVTSFCRCGVTKISD